MDELTLTFLNERLDRIEDKLDDLLKSHLVFRGKVIGATLILSVFSGGLVSYLVLLGQK